MNQKQNTRLFAYLTVILVVLLSICAVAALALGVTNLVTKDPTPQETTQATDDTPTLTPPTDVTLKEGEDAGMAYIDKMIFFGESTTAHLSSRGGLSNGVGQVWKDASGTKRLSSRLLSETIVYPPTGESITLEEAVRLEKPEYMVLSFGLNGITDFIKDKASYVNNYNKLIRAIREASPDTKIILQSVYPVTAACEGWNESGATVSQYTRTLNEWLPEIAAMNPNVRYVDTASVLTDEDGCLDERYDYNGDGVHLTADAYVKIISYLRTHPWQE